MRVTWTISSETYADVVQSHRERLSPGAQVSVVDDLHANQRQVGVIVKKNMLPGCTPVFLWERFSLPPHIVSFFARNRCSRGVSSVHFILRTSCF